MSTGISETKFVSEQTTKRVLEKMRVPGSKRRAVRVMRPTLQQIQMRLRRNRRALEIAAANKAGAALLGQLQTEQALIVGYLNSLHGKA